MRLEQADQQQAMAVAGLTPEDSVRTPPEQIRLSESSQMSSETPAEELNTVLADLKRISRVHKFFAWTWPVLLGFFVEYALVVAAIIAVAWKLHGHPPTIHWNFSPDSWALTGNYWRGSSDFTISCVTPVLLIIGSYFAAKRAKRARTSLTETVMKHEGVKATGAYIDALFLKNRAISTSIASALTRLLPKLSCEDADRLTNEERTKLGQYLTRSYFSSLPNNPELDESILEFCGRVGDHKQEAAARKIAEGKILSGRNSTTREKALEYLEIVKRQKEALRAPEVLLRASVHDSREDTLVKPAQGPGETELDTLLRPVQRLNSD